MLLQAPTTTRVLHTTDVPAAAGTTGIFFERDVRSSLPFCHAAFPKNQFGDVFDGVLADDERVVAFRYKVSGVACLCVLCVLEMGADGALQYNDDGLTMDVVFDVWTL